MCFAINNRRLATPIRAASALLAPIQPLTILAVLISVNVVVLPTSAKTLNDPTPDEKPTQTPFLTDVDVLDPHKINDRIRHAKNGEDMWCV